MATLKRKTNNGYEPLPAMVVRKTNAENGNGIGTCSTSSGTALVVSLTGYELVTNGFVAVTFENDVPANATLNINSKGTKPIFYKGSAITAGTIKAGDTVMFAYDGTNYVVTSLGGGGGSVVFPEFVTISLTQSSGSDSDLIGVTVVVTDDDTSATIFSTAWDGSDIAVQVDDGVDYTVTVGNVTNYSILSNTQSYTATSGLTKIITFKYQYFAVDLGLPSKLKWAAFNVGATNAWDSGYFFSWGNIVGHQAGDGYNIYADYPNTPGYSLTADIPAGSATYDAARAYMGGNWKMPSYSEWVELIDYTDQEWVENYMGSGVNGMKFMNKYEHSVFIFMPAAGTINGETPASVNIYGSYWTRTKYAQDNTSAYRMVFGNTGCYKDNNQNRTGGFNVRGVV